MIRKFLVCLSFFCSLNVFASSSVVEINDYWNRLVTYTKEPRGEDIWQTPEETISLGTGDCEDIAIVKYFALIASGVDREKLSLALVLLEDTVSISSKYIVHILLLYKTSDETYVIDNYSKDITELNKRKDIVKIGALLNHKEILSHNKETKSVKSWGNIRKNFNTHVEYMRNYKEKIENCY